MKDYEYSYEDRQFLFMVIREAQVFRDKDTSGTYRGRNLDTFVDAIRFALEGVTHLGFYKNEETSDIDRINLNVPVNMDLNQATLTLAYGKPKVMVPTSKTENFYTRVTYKPYSWAKFLKLMVDMGLPIPDQYVEILQDKFTLLSSGTDAFSHRVVRGSELIKKYGVTPSCMSHAGYMEETLGYFSDYANPGELNRNSGLALYSLNPDKVGLIVFSRDGTDIGRALLWNADNGKKFMDRVYPTDGGLIGAYATKLAKENGWITRENVRDGTPVVVTMRDVGAYPYMDTLVVGELDDELLILRDEYNHKYGHVRLTHTDNYDPFNEDPVFYMFDENGEVSRKLNSDDYGTRSTCDDCGDRYDHEEMFRLANGNIVCYVCVDHYRYLDYRRRDGSWVSGYYSENEYDSLIFEGEWHCFLRGEAVETYDGELIPPQFAVALVDGSFGCSNDPNIVPVYCSDPPLWEFKDRTVELSPQLYGYRDLSKSQGKRALPNQTVVLVKDSQEHVVLKNNLNHLIVTRGYTLPEQAEEVEHA